MKKNINPKLKVKIIREETIENTPIKEGQLIINQDSGELHLDLEGKRAVVGRNKWSKITKDNTDV